MDLHGEQSAGGPCPGEHYLSTPSISPSLSTLTDPPTPPPQALLKNNATAALFSTQLSATNWTVEDVSTFLAKQADRDPATEGALTWRHVFNETDQAIKSISRFMEVSR